MRRRVNALSLVTPPTRSMRSEVNKREIMIIIIIINAGLTIFNRWWSIISDVDAHDGAMVLLKSELIWVSVMISFVFIFEGFVGAFWIQKTSRRWYCGSVLVARQLPLFDPVYFEKFWRFSWDDFGTKCSSFTDIDSTIDFHMLLRRVCMDFNILWTSKTNMRGTRSAKIKLPYGLVSIAYANGFLGGIYPRLEAILVSKLHSEVDSKAIVITSA